MKKERNKQIILIVEDDIPVRMILVNKLTREGYNILQAKDGEEGLTVAIKEHPNIILLDIIMPKLDGLSMMEKLRAKNDWGKNVPIVLLTNLNFDDDKLKEIISKDKSTYYLLKANWSMDYIAEKVREILEKESQTLEPPPRIELGTSTLRKSRSTD